MDYKWRIFYSLLCDIIVKTQIVFYLCKRVKGSVPFLSLLEFCILLSYHGISCDDYIRFIDVITSQYHRAVRGLNFVTYLRNLTLNHIPIKEKFQPL